MYKMEILQHGHKDMVECVDYNSIGNRFALGSADGTIQVFDKVRSGGWLPCDAWQAHTAETLEIRWLPSTLQPNLIASISLDGTLKIWMESSSTPHMSGERFITRQRSGNSIFQLRCTNGAYLSFSIRHDNITKQTFLALVDRTAMVTVYINDEPENPTNWAQIDQFRCGEPTNLGAEASMCIRFDPNLEPSYEAIRAGLPQDGLGLLVATGDRLRMWRSRNVVHDVTLGSGKSIEFYEACEFKGHNGLIREVDWAPGSVRGYDYVASTCKDGMVRIWEVRTPIQSHNGVDKDVIGSHGLYTKYPAESIRDPTKHTVKPGKGAPRSAITAGLAPKEGRQQERIGIKHKATLVGALDNHHGPVWRCHFDPDGQMLGSVGDDGRLLLWRRKFDGQWAQSSEIAAARGHSPRDEV